jgi:ribosomal protein S18 acetylase RimI-like enzyme
LSPTRTTPRTPGYTPPELTDAAFHLRTTATDEVLLVAAEGGTVVGALHGRLHDSPRSAQMASVRRLHVETVVVDGTTRRRGAGKALMAAAEAWAKARGAAQVVLTVWDGNTVADTFYRKIGYSTVSQVLARDL